MKIGGQSHFRGCTGNPILISSNDNGRYMSIKKKKRGTDRSSDVTTHQNNSQIRIEKKKKKPECARFIVPTSDD